VKFVDICVVPSSKIHRYSPTEQAKVWDKPLTGKAKMTFNPSQAMDLDRETPKTCHKKMTPKLRCECTLLVFYLNKLAGYDFSFTI
jgi:hypothetical protein